MSDPSTTPSPAPPPAPPPEAAPPPAPPQTPPQTPASTTAQAAPTEEELAKLRHDRMAQLRELAEQQIKAELAAYEAGGYAELKAAYDVQNRRISKLSPLGYFAFFFIWTAISSALLLRDHSRGLRWIIVDLLVGFACAATFLVYALLAVGPAPEPPTPTFRRAHELDEVRDRYAQLLKLSGLSD